MKRVLIILSMSMMIAILAACGAEDSAVEKETEETSSNTEEVVDDEEVEETVGDFKEVESFELEGKVSSMNFNLDEDGDTLYWGENDGGIGDDKRRYVRFNEEVKELDLELYSQFSFLSPTGEVITDETAEDGKTLTLIEYNPATDEVKKYDSAIDDSITLHPSPGTYIKDPKKYVHIETRANLNDRTLYWDIEKDKLIDLSFLKDIVAEVGDITGYVNYFLNSDGSMIYGTLMDVGVFSHDVASGKTKTLLETDNILPQGRYTNMVTSDDKYLIYGTSDEESFEAAMTYYALDVETQETIELGSGTGVYTLTNGNVIIVDENDVNLYDFEKATLETIHTIAIEENEKIDNITISLDGSTIAYGYTAKHDDAEEEEDERTYHMTILSNK